MDGNNELKDTELSLSGYKLFSDGLHGGVALITIRGVPALTHQQMCIQYIEAPGYFGSLPYLHRSRWTVALQVLSETSAGPIMRDVYDICYSACLCPLSSSADATHKVWWSSWRWSSNNDSWHNCCSPHPLSVRHHYIVSCNIGPSGSMNMIYVLYSSPNPNAERDFPLINFFTAMFDALQLCLDANQIDWPW